MRGQQTFASPDRELAIVQLHFVGPDKERKGRHGVLGRKVRATWLKLAEVSVESREGATGDACEREPLWARIHTLRHGMSALQEFGV